MLEMAAAESKKAEGGGKKKNSIRHPVYGECQEPWHQRFFLLFLPEVSKT